MQVEERADIQTDVNKQYLHPGTHWRWGFTPSAEVWNGRLAMIGFSVTLLIEILAKDGFLEKLFSGLF